MSKEINVLSLFDGMSCGRIALDRAKIPVGTYYASEIDKYAIQVSEANYPDIVRLGDVTKWRKWAIDWASIDLLIAGSPCFVKGTKIFTDRGFIGIEDVKVGDRVYTHKHRFKKVKKIGGQISGVRFLKSQSSTGTETTDNHPYYVRRRSKVWNNARRTHEFVFSTPEFLPCKELTKDHYLATPVVKTSKNPYRLTEEECFIIGLYVGDGHTRKDFRKSEGRDNDRQWQLIISVSDKEAQLFKTKITENHYSFYSHAESVNRAVFSNKRLVKYVEYNCGIGSINKHLSDNILNLPKHLLDRVIEGYLFADGSFRGKTHRATTVSRHLVESLTLAVAKCYETTTSIEFTKRPKKTVIQGREVNQKDTWSVSFQKNHPKQSRAWVIDGYIWNPIKENYSTNDSKPVFNIEVDEDNSYIANNNAVHNCQGFSFAGKKLAFDDPRSALFFVFVDILNHIKALNPDVKFLLENVRMKKEYLAIISEHVGVEPVFINSKLLSAQSRPRYYWANWSFEVPEDKGIFLRDIVEPIVDEKFKHSDKLIAGYARKAARRKLEAEAEAGSSAKFDAFGVMNIAELDGKASCLTARYHKSFISDLSIACAAMIGRRIDPETGKRADDRKDIKPQQRLEIRSDGKTNCLTTVQKDNYIVKSAARRSRGDEIRGDGKANALLADGHQSRWLANDSDILYRKLTPIECERLQTVPDNYTNHVSNTQRYRMLGNGWTVDVIAHILESMDFERGPVAKGPCAKQTVNCTIVAADGKRYTGTNYCNNPQAMCPREVGEDYTKCKTICNQSGHAEINALRAAGENAKGGRAILSGHTHVCMDCQHAIYGAGIKSISVI